MMKTLGLALGGGSARGFAHIGVLQVLEEEKIPIDYICGCSMGALIGGVYAAGTDLYMLAKLVASVDRKEYFDFTLPKRGFIKGEKFLALAQMLTKNKTFDEMQIPFTCVACAIEEGTTHLLSSGNVAQAIRASISIPGVFEPHQIGGTLYVDGGVLDVVPSKFTRQMGADFVLAVDVGIETRSVEIRPRLFEILMRANSITGSAYRMTKRKEADFTICPDVSGVNSYSNEEAEFIIEEGRKAMQAALPQVRELLKD